MRRFALSVIVLALTAAAADAGPIYRAVANARERVEARRSARLERRPVIAAPVLAVARLVRAAPAVVTGGCAGGSCPR